MKNEVFKAIILAAGKGKRLYTLTKDRPKCLLRINGKPLIINTLKHLNRVDVKETIIVVGYKAREIIRRVGQKFEGMKITYVFNPIFDRTNNIYSLWLTKKYLKNFKYLILIEGDIYFKADILREVVREKHENIMVVGAFRKGMNGTVVSLNENLIVKDVFLKKEQRPNFDFSRKFKTVNIYKFSRDMVFNHLLPVIDNYIYLNRVNDFYEIAIRDLVQQKTVQMRALVINEPWVDIDTMIDLYKANIEKAVS